MERTVIEMSLGLVQLSGQVQCFDSRNKLTKTDHSAHVVLVHFRRSLSSDATRRQSPTMVKVDNEFIKKILQLFLLNKNGLVEFKY